MEPREITLRVDSPQPSESILAGLAPDFQVGQHEIAGERTSHYWDTFDWRLRRHSLELVVQGGAAVLSGSNGEPMAEGRAQDVQPFLHTFPEGELKEQLLPLIPPRRLMPFAQILEGRESWRVLDRRRKTVARLQIERRVLTRAQPGGARHDHTLVRLTPLRGYGEEVSKIERTLARNAALEATAFHPLSWALSQLQIEACDPSELRLLLDPTVQAGAGLRQIFKALLDVMEANEAGTKADLDPEHLHDFRVALRRTRSLLSQVKGVLAKDDSKRFRTEFSWLGDRTGTVRDLDVFLLFLQNEAGRGVRAASFGDLQRRLAREKKRAQAALAEELDSARYRELKGDWRALLESPPEKSSGPRASQPLREVLARRIHKLHKKILKRGAKAGPKSPAKELHALRLLGKKLRYLLDGSPGLFPEEARLRAIKSLKRIQNHLGDFNDCEVQRAWIERLAGRGHDPEALLSLGAILERLRTGAEESRAAFFKSFERFAHSAEDFRVLTRGDKR